MSLVTTRPYRLVFAAIGAGWADQPIVALVAEGSTVEDGNVGLRLATDATGRAIAILRDLAQASSR